MAKGDKYVGLKRFLVNSNKVQLRLSFSDIEKMIGAPLPDSASNYATVWWANDYSHSQAVAWMDAGYETDFVSDTYKDKAIIFIKK